METIWLSVRQTRAFADGDINIDALGELLAQSDAATLDKLAFNSGSLTLSGDRRWEAIDLRRGVSQIEGRQIGIDRVRVERRRVILWVTAESRIADLYFRNLTSAVTDAMNGAAGPWPKEPLLQIDHTKWRGTLDVKPEHFVDGRLCHEVERYARTSSSADIVSRGSVESIAFRFSYESQNDKMRKAGVVLGSKKLRLLWSTRDATWESEGPARTEVHLRFLEQLSSVFATA